MAYKSSEATHKYPKTVHIMDNPVLTSQLAKLCHPETKQPDFNRLVTSIYTGLFIEVLNNEWPVTSLTMPTRMTTQHPDAKLTSSVLDLNQQAVIVNIARAGMLPSQVGFDLLCQTVNPDCIRQDHVYAARVTDEHNKVTHTDLSGSKIGGDIEKALVMLPDPMGATGHSLSATLDHYKKEVQGTAKKIIAIHLIVTPEYLKNITAHHPDVLIYTVRVDRGLSPQDVLRSPLGEFWDKEKGLNANQYIVPGAGGVGELINNSFV
ncbi:MAG: uracil phosphoribosyltransferase [Bdellovibrionaceae bacterium]|nr:uracil phosphoribosyltransferase [Pseudobdellovibrionaceae bacterium]